VVRAALPAAAHAALTRARPGPTSPFWSVPAVYIHGWRGHLCVGQAYPEGQREPVGCIVCKLDDHKGRERGYIAMLSVAKTWRKRGIGASRAYIHI
jgi:ribosomal protein S18 acetylase RimI-like enzyme